MKAEHFLTKIVDKDSCTHFCVSLLPFLTAFCSTQLLSVTTRKFQYACEIKKSKLTSTCDLADVEAYVCDSNDKEIFNCSPPPSFCYFPSGVVIFIHNSKKSRWLFSYV